MARRCGVQSPLKPVYSVALGTSGISPLEMASAYTTFATGGVHHTPYLIQRVEDAAGNVLQEHIVQGKRELDPAISYQVVDMMQAVVNNGTGRSIRRLGFDLPAAGKTGTSNDYKDAWFTGFTPRLCTTVWVGFDRQKGLRRKPGGGITGGRAAAPIWAAFMKKATEGDPRHGFPRPPGIRFDHIDPQTGCQADSALTPSVRVALRDGQTVCPAPLSPALLPLPSLDEPTADTTPDLEANIPPLGPIRDDNAGGITEQVIEEPAPEPPLVSPETDTTPPQPVETETLSTSESISEDVNDVQPMPNETELPSEDLPEENIDQTPILEEDIGEE